MSDEDNYQLDYYQRNRESILAKRAKRYREDSEYRDARLEASSIQKNKRRIATKKKRRPVARKGKAVKPKEHMVSVAGRDVKVMMFSAGQLGDLLGRKTQTIRLWEKKGLLPEAMYRDARGMRLYTQLQVKELRAAYLKVRRDSPTLSITRISSTDFPRLAHAIWSRWPLGIET